MLCARQRRVALPAILCETMTSPVTFIGTCVGLPQSSLEAYDETERDISYRTFRRHVGGDVVREIDEAVGVPVGKDWHVSFGRGIYEGKPAVCMHHSAIHDLYALPERTGTESRKQN